MANFIAHHTQALHTSLNYLTTDAGTPISPLTRTGAPDNAPSGSASSKDLEATKRALHGLLIDLRGPFSFSLAQSTVSALSKLQVSGSFAQVSATDDEAALLERAVVGKLVVSLYGESLRVYLDAACAVEAEAEWWAELERRHGAVAWFLVQTLPSRVLDAAHTIIRALRQHNLPLTPASFSPASLRRLFPSRHNLLRPGALTLSLFPHLRGTAHLGTLLALSTPDLAATPAGASPAADADAPLPVRLRRLVRRVEALVTLPVSLARSEVAYKRKSLEDLRDARAATLGALAALRAELLAAITASPSPSASVSRDSQADALRVFVLKLRALTSSDAGAHAAAGADMLADLCALSFALPSVPLTPPTYLRRPSRLALLWPRLVLIPPLTLLAVRELYAKRASLLELWMGAAETVHGFIWNWVVSPIQDVLKTVRTGGEGAVIVHAEGVKADLDSLERMALALAADELHYTPAQLAALSQRVRVGDLTPILELYESAIRAPVRSALTGRLLRSLFIQVQKAKVDLDQALSGIDRLLRSQELTFAAVGLAPALGVVYVAGSALLGVVRGGRGRGRYGGRRRRGEAWAAMRRVERLLNAPSASSSSPMPGSAAALRGLPAKYNEQDREIPPLMTGLLLLSLATLRGYAAGTMPARSRLHEGFLEDVGDLESVEMGRREKMRVVERMWRSWGGVLGWERVGGEI